MIGAGGQGRLTDLRDYTVRARLFSSKSTLFNLPPRALLSTTTTTMTSSREERFQTQESPSNPGRSRDRLGRMNTELVEAALAASRRRLVVLDDGEVTDDLVRDMVEVLTSFCARLYGRHSARNRAIKALNCAKNDVGPMALSRPAETMGL